MTRLKCIGEPPYDMEVQILDGDNLIGEITAWEGGVRIASPLLENRMVMGMLEPLESALRIRLIHTQVPILKEAERAMKFEEVVEGAVQEVYNAVFGGKLAPGEERMAWAMVMTKLLQSMTIDLQSQMLAERAGAPRTRKAGGGSIITP